MSELSMRFMSVFNTVRHFRERSPAAPQNLNSLFSADRPLFWQRNCNLLKTMDGAYLTAMAALGGAAVGGFTSFATSWTTLRTQMKAEGNASSKNRRRKVYTLFINQASKMYGDSLIHDTPDLAGLIELHALVNRIRIISSAPVIENAVKVVRVITETYSQPNRSPIEIEAMIQDGSVDLLSRFSEACRAELE